MAAKILDLRRLQLGPVSAATIRRIIAARKKFQDEQRQEIAGVHVAICKRPGQNLAAIAPGDLDMVFLGSSGSEAMEAALKIAEQAQGPERATVVYAENSFHGKTKGTLRR